MFPHFIALPLPTDLRKRLASFCYGIPQVKWLEEENFNLVIRYFGPINEIAILDIRENLKNLFFHPLTITLQGITHNYSKKSGGIISIGIVPNPQILLLRKEIDTLLKKIPASLSDRTPLFYVTLGRYDKIHPVKLGDFLEAHSLFMSEPFEINRCHFLRAHQTAKHMIYEVLEEYTASPVIDGED